MAAMRKPEQMEVRSQDAITGMPPVRPSFVVSTTKITEIMGIDLYFLPCGSCGYQTLKSYYLRSKL
jgi:hypothetical protein